MRPRTKCSIKTIARSLDVASAAAEIQEAFVDKTLMEKIYMSHGTCETNNGPRAIELTLAALVDGLRIKDRQLNVQCFRALASMGQPFEGVIFMLDIGV